MVNMKRDGYDSVRKHDAHSRRLGNNEIGRSIVIRVGGFVLRWISLPCLSKILPCRISCSNVAAAFDSLLDAIESTKWPCPLQA